MTDDAATSTVAPSRARHAVLDEPRPSTAAPVRSLAPDLARGALLLFIALANVWSYLHGRELAAIGDRPLDATGVDRLVDGLTTLLVDDRSRPMFAILYGFGIATMATRLTARGNDARGVRRVLARRSVALIVLGLLHAALLFPYDILAPYGVTGLLALALVDRSRVALLRWFWGSLTLMLVVFVPVVYGWVSFGGGTGEPTADYLASAVERVGDAATQSAMSGLLLLFVPQVVMGILLARSGWLTDPARHRARLGRTALVSGLVVLVVNVPHALAVARVWEPSFYVGRTTMLVHEVSGMAGGFAYVCLFGWLAAVWADRRRGAAVQAVAAVGQRSLTSYLLQSVMFAPLLSAWGLGWGAHLGTAQAAALAIGVWLVTVAVAVALSRAGRTGPFEVLLRRWTYGRR